MQGGAIGDKDVVFRATAPLAADASIALSNVELAVSENGGSVTLKVENRTFGGMEDHGPATIMVKPALMVTPEPADPAPEAKAASDFMNFGQSAADGSAVLRATLGTFQVGVVGADSVADQLRSARGTSNVATLQDIVSTAGTTPNPVRFSVEQGFGFTAALALAPADGDCQAPGEDLRVAVTPATDPVTYEDQTSSVAATEFESAPRHLCVEVSGETVIPNTAPFMAMVSYDPLDDDAAFPPGPTSHELAAIGRDGATVRLPFLATRDKYRQRLHIMNHGAPTTYSLTGLSSAMGTVDATMMASGDLPTGQTILKVWELVEGEGTGGAVTGTLSIVTDPSNIDAALHLVHPETQSVDVEHLTVE